MYRSFTSLLAFFGTFLFCSADVILFSNGNSQEVVVKEITPTEIKYIKSSRSNGPLYSVLKSDVVSITYDDGTVDTFATKVEENNNKDNNALAQSNLLEKKKYEIEVFSKENETNKEAKACYGLCRFDDESIICDENLKIEYISGIYSPIVKNTSNNTISLDDGPFWHTNSLNKPYVFWAAIKVKLSNLSSKTIYVDLANTFFRRGSHASPYYIPTSTTSIKREGGGIGVNLVGVMDALGVGGALGSLASGINLGSSSASYISTTTYSQRIISIPPHSSVELEPQLLFPPNLPTGAYKVSTKHYGFNFDIWQLVGLDKTNLSVNIGQAKDYNEDSSPISFGLFLSYSFDENFSEIKTLKNTAYLSRLIGLESYKPAARARWQTNKADNLSERFLEPLHFFLFIH